MVIFVDWGSSNRRCYKCDGDTIIDEIAGGPGALSVAPADWEGEIAAIRSALNCPADTLVLMSGMVGSNRGWIEVSYVPCPAGLKELAANVHWHGRAGIVPGLSLLDGENADVMRGEEMQVLGALSARLIPPAATLCTPGTHNKWIRVEDGRIRSFATSMTGEMFQLLRQHSILSDMLLGAEVTPGPAFSAGVAHALERDDLLNALFQVRARVLLGKLPRADAASYVSGLVIGTDVRGEGALPDPVYTICEPALAEIYAVAIAAAGGRAHRVDAKRAFISGMRQIMDLTA